MRTANITRNTNETKITLSLNLDDSGADARIDTGLGFFDHMLNLFAFRAGIALAVTCDGDLHVDGHHTVEDIGIALGQAVAKALGDKKGLARYGSARCPMDECLAEVDMDISNRPYLVFHAALGHKRMGTTRVGGGRTDEGGTRLVGGFETELTEEFFRAFAVHAGITLHINLLYGKNTHHKMEAIFKAFGMAFCQAIQVRGDKIPSTKGAL